LVLCSANKFSGLKKEALAYVNDGGKQFWSRLLRGHYDAHVELAVMLNLVSTAHQEDNRWGSVGRGSPRRHCALSYNSSVGLQLPVLARARRR
jgi:hypothetical protein